MKIEINKCGPVLKYPCLMVSASGILVFFKGVSCGTVIKSAEHGPCGFYQPGDYSISWNMSSFTPFNGTVTLSND